MECRTGSRQNFSRRHRNSGRKTSGMGKRNSGILRQLDNDVEIRYSRKCGSIAKTRGFKIQTFRLDELVG